MMPNDIQRWILSKRGRLGWAWGPTIESGWWKRTGCWWILDNWPKYEPGPGHSERTILMRAPAGWLWGAAQPWWLVALMLHSLFKLNGRLQTLYQGWLNCLLHLHWSVGQKLYQPEATIRVCNCDKYCIHFSYWMGEYTLHPGWLKCLLQQFCFHTRAPECWTKVISTRGNHKCLQRWQILLSLLKLNGSLLHHR